VHDATAGYNAPVVMRSFLRPIVVYLVLESGAALFFSLASTVVMLYQVIVVELTPLQLVLMGTTLETTIFVFEIPTGIVADLKSRRLSVIIGYVIIGVSYMVLGSFPIVWVVAFSQVLWGLGYTFTSGATQAWVADEIGEAQAGQAFLRGTQAARAGALLGIPVSVALGRIALHWPILLSGGGLLMMAGFLALAMSEEGFAPVPSGERTTWDSLRETLHDARQVVHRQPALLTLLAIALFYGLYSEGFDRLWTPHLLDNFPIMAQGAVEPVIVFGFIRGVMLVVSVFATEVAKRRVATDQSTPIARALMVIATLIVISLAGFGLTRSFWLALSLYWLIGALRSVAAPLHAAWFNLRIDDPQVRATMFSVVSQMDAIGEIAGGPAVGVIGNRSIRTALVTSALILSPVLPLYQRARRRSDDSRD
jgi:DHA3 family tetracycline resistance protein-like MFS transporter